MFTLTAGYSPSSLSPATAGAGARIDRQLSLELLGGPPWGFRLCGGSSAPSGPLPVLVARVRKRSRAHEAGLEPGDQLMSINGTLCISFTKDQAMSLIASSIGRLQLCLLRKAEPSYMNLIEAELQMDESEPVEVTLGSRSVRFEPAPSPPPAELNLLMKSEEADTWPDDGLLQIAEAKVRPASPDVTPISIERLTREPADAEAEIISPTKKKVFSDSSFFQETSGASALLFPTVEEEKKLAKRVAMSLTDVLNQNSRGAAMFERLRNRAEKHCLEAVGVKPVDGDENAGPTTPTSTTANEVLFEGVPPAPPPPPPPPPAPKTSAELFEAIKKTPRTGHLSVPPETCFDIAAALHSNKGRGAALFQKRRAKAEKWVASESQGQRPVSEIFPPTAAIPSQPAIDSMDSATGSRPPRARSPTEAFSQKQTRLEQLLASQKLKSSMSPWEAALHDPYGQVHAAFEHLGPPGTASPSAAGGHSSTAGDAGESASQQQRAQRVLPFTAPKLPTAASVSPAHSASPGSSRGGGGVGGPESPVTRGPPGAPMTTKASSAAISIKPKPNPVQLPPPRAYGPASSSGGLAPSIGTPIVKPPESASGTSPLPGAGPTRTILFNVTPRGWAAAQ